MKVNKKVEMHMEDISRIFPHKLLLSKKELAQIRNTSISTINRELCDGVGVPYVVSRGKKMYPIRNVAEWLANSVVMA